MSRLPALHYVTDDRDKDQEDQHSLVILAGGNGDWYVAVGDAQGRAHNFVRLCTSGGASSHCPGLTVAIAEAYRAMQAAQRGDRRNDPSYADLLEEVKAWRACYPKQVCEYGRIYEDGEIVGRGF